MPNTTSFDLRNVRYEEIHSIKREDYDALVDAVELRDNMSILDCGSGYGAVTREILQRAEAEKRTGLRVDLIDESHYQLERARKELARWIDSGMVTIKFIHGTFPQDCPAENRYDVIIAKMVLHEVPVESQPAFVEALFGHLNEGGRVAVWDLCLAPESAEFYRQTIREKDRLAGFETMTQRRHFLSEPEMRALFDNSSFHSVEFYRNIAYRFETKKRLGPELRGDTSLLEALNAAIRNRTRTLPAEILPTLAIQDDGDNISFAIRKAIFVGTRQAHATDEKKAPRAEAVAV